MVTATSEVLKVCQAADAEEIALIVRAIPSCSTTSPELSATTQGSQAS